MHRCLTRRPASLNASSIVRACKISGSSPIGAPSIDLGSWPSSEAQCAAIRTVFLQFSGSTYGCPNSSGRQGSLNIKVLVRVEEDVVAGLVIRIPEDRFETRPPQFVEVLALVDHDGIELVLRPQPLTRLHQGLRSHIGPEILMGFVSRISQSGTPAILTKFVRRFHDSCRSRGRRRRTREPRPAANP